MKQTKQKNINKHQKPGRRLIIDVQILQTPAFDRGMGKYTLSLLKAFLADQKIYDTVELMFSENLTKDKERIGYVQKFVGAYNSIFLDLPVDIAADMKDKHLLAQKTIDEYIDKTTISDEHTDFLITSPFFVGFPAVFPNNPEIGKYSLVYDIIPMKIWHLLRIFPDDIYFNHFKIFFEADGLFTISQAVKDDLISMVGVDEKKITNIDGGPFKKLSKDKLKKINLKHPYILYPSAPIVHKNNERAVNAFEQFNKKQGGNYTLYLTSTFDSDYQERLRAISKNVEFTGNISDEELAYVYTQAEVLFFPSLSEGLGMPVLEAVQYQVPVACSAIPVLTEISGKAFYQFSPTNIDEIRKALCDAARKHEWQSKQSEYRQVERKYTWQKSAVSLTDAFKAKARKPGLKTSLTFVLPSPRSDTPAGTLGEESYAVFQETFDLSVNILKKSKKNLKASFLEYVAEKPGSHERQVKFRDKISVIPSVKGTKKIEVILQTGTKKQHLTVSARRVFKDNAVQLKGWEFTTNDGQIFTPSELLKLYRRTRKI